MDTVNLHLPQISTLLNPAFVAPGTSPSPPDIAPLPLRIGRERRVTCLVEGWEDVVGELDLGDGGLAHARIPDRKPRDALLTAHTRSSMGSSSGIAYCSNRVSRLCREGGKCCRDNGVSGGLAYLFAEGGVEDPLAPEHLTQPHGAAEHPAERHVLAEDDLGM